jgi:hypothetical protein
VWRTNEVGYGRGMAEDLEQQDDNAPFTNDSRHDQLVAPGDEEGIDDEPDAVARVVEGGSAAPHLDQIADDEVVPAEEAAMHLTAEPPVGDGDGYIDG